MHHYIKVTRAYVFQRLPELVEQFGADGAVDKSSCQVEKWPDKTVRDDKTVLELQVFAALDTRVLPNKDAGARVRFTNALSPDGNPLDAFAALSRGAAAPTEGGADVDLEASLAHLI